MNTIHQTHGMIHLRQNIKEKSSCFGTKGSDFSWRHQDLVMYNKTSLFLLFGKTMSSTHPMVNNQNIQQRLSTINNTWSFRHSAHSSSYQNFKVLNLISSQISSGVDWTAKKNGRLLVDPPPVYVSQLLLCSLNLSHSWSLCGPNLYWCEEVGVYVIVGLLTD